MSPNPQLSRSKAGSYKPLIVDIVMNAKRPASSACPQKTKLKCTRLVQVDYDRAEAFVVDNNRTVNAIR